MGKARGKNRKKRPLGLGRVILNRSKRESFYFLKEEEKREKVVARVGYLGVCLSTPANEKLLSIFHHTHTRESFLDIPI